MLPTMPMGASPRLEAVLRAGHMNRVSAMYTGAPGDSQLKAAGQKVISNNNASAKKNAANSKLRKAGQAVLATNKPPALMSAKTSPVVMYDDGITEVSGPEMMWTTSKTTPEIEDLVNGYQMKAAERRKEIERVREEAKECARNRRKAVDDYQAAEEAAAYSTIKKLQEELADKEAMIDEMQNQSTKALKDLEDAKSSGGASSEEVKRLMALISQLNVEKSNINVELDNLKASSDEERDAAQREADAEKEKLEAAWQLKLDEALAASKAGDVASSKELAACTRKLEKAVEDLETETKAHNALDKASFEKDRKFYDAAKAACDALSEFTKESPDESFRKKTMDFVTSAPASAKANDVQGETMRA